jgi:ArsR family transcriptional regulator, arsenate/arsenite/antimonite-responsive transcriptional repressor
MPKAADPRPIPFPEVGPVADLSGHAPILRALGDPTQLRIVAVLAAATGPLAMADLVSVLGIKQPRVALHLRGLLDVGAVRCERHGTWAFYRLDRSLLAPLLELVRALGADAHTLDLGEPFGAADGGEHGFRGPIRGPLHRE